MNIDNRVSFCADFKPIVKFNKSRWNEIIPDFKDLTNDYQNCKGLYLIQTGTPGKQKYCFTIKLRNNSECYAEDSVFVPTEVIGKWLAGFDNKEIAAKLEKIFRILNIRRQAIYDLRKLPDGKNLEQEFIADRYLKRMRQFAKSDPDIIVPKETVYNGAKGVWISQMDAKREIYELKNGELGRQVLAVV